MPYAHFGSVRRGFVGVFGRSWLSGPPSLCRANRSAYVILPSCELVQEGYIPSGAGPGSLNCGILMNKCFLSLTAIFMLGVSAYCVAVCGADVAAGPSSARAAEAATVTARGWLIESVRAIKRSIVTEVFPDFQGGKRGQDRKATRQATKGQFIIIEVRSRWATTEAPDAQLWTGKPDATLVDGNGVEYPAEHWLVRKGGDYITPTMTIPANSKGKGDTVPRTSRMLVYFDVPANLPAPVSIRVAANAPLLTVIEGTDLPEADSDILR